MIALRKASLRHGRTLVLDDADVCFPPGRLTAIIGPNGAGKSTLLKVASGEWKASAGEVHINGRGIATLPAGMLAALRAVVPQASHLAFPFTALDVVSLGVSVPGFGSGPPDGAREALAAVGLSGFEGRLYTELSGGERQRVHIARALCQLEAGRRPADVSPTLLLDEPTASLDPGHQTLIMALLRQRADRGWAVVVVLHDLNLTAAWVDHVVLMQGGRLESEGVPRDVLTEAKLSLAYGCPMGVNALPGEGTVFVLPHHQRALEARPI